MDEKLEHSRLIYKPTPCLIVTLPLETQNRIEPDKKQVNDHAGVSEFKNKITYKD